ncbi:MAG TPA: hypothetical protein VK484_07585, partial [Ferruginibacter sp.]|nr:hypothetical protein [Ferruginibacter sp.]
CDSPEKTANEQKETPVEKPSFFPVTAYIKGQLYEIKNKGANPLKYTIINNHTDSVWIKVQDIEDAVKEFLHPEIDSVNLVSLFTEKKFLDQSIDAYTFTYEPTAQLPDSMVLKRWDVHIDPATGKVRRIYMVKNISDTKMLQLTWQSNKWCKISTIITDQKGESTIEKEEKITWDF